MRGALNDFRRADPTALLDLASESLERSAAMMNEIIEETRRDRIEFGLRSKQIDRTLTRIDEILAGLVQEP